METVTLDFKNYKTTHLCGCDEISEKKKQNWLKNHMQDGVIYRRTTEGENFMEYMPTEDAWCPVEAPQTMFIHAFQTKDNPKAAKVLLRECIADCRIKGRQGLAAMVCDEKRPYLPQASLLESLNFHKCDTFEHYHLYFLPLEEETVIPKFSVKEKNRPKDQGLVIYYSQQCPETLSRLEKIFQWARVCSHPHKIVAVDIPREKEDMDREDIIRPQEMPWPYTIYAVFWNSQFLTDDITKDLTTLLPK